MSNIMRYIAETTWSGTPGSTAWPTVREIQALWKRDPINWTQTDADSTSQTYGKLYDVFRSVWAEGTIQKVAYGMAAYRIATSNDYRNGAKNIQSVTIGSCTRTPGFPSGLRITLQVTDSETPMSTMADGDYVYSGFLADNETRGGGLSVVQEVAGNLTLDVETALKAATRGKYLWVYFDFANATETEANLGNLRSLTYAEPVQFAGTPVAYVNNPDSGSSGGSSSGGGSSGGETGGGSSGGETGGGSSGGETGGGETGGRVTIMSAGVSPTFLQPQEVVAVAEVVSSVTALNTQGGILSKMSPFVALADLAVQVVSANTQNSDRSPQDIFFDLLTVATAKTTDDIVAEAAAPTGIPIPLSQCERLTILPRLVLGTNLPEQTPAQTGISVWFNIPSDCVRVPVSPDGNSTGRLAVKNPAFIQASSLVIRTSAPGKNLTLSGVFASNTGVNLRIAVWRSARATEWSKSVAYPMASILVADPAMHRTLAAGTTVSTKEKPLTLPAYQDLGPIPSVSATLIGVSKLIDGPVSANDTLSITLRTTVEPGDILILVPVIDSITPQDGQTSYHFGRQADPAIHSADHGGIWGRYPENLGWFPAVDIY